MNWLRNNEFTQRPLVAVEDHVYHISELLRVIQRTAPELLRSLTVVCLDRAGPDTDAAVREWCHDYPQIQVASRFADPGGFELFANRVEQLDDNIFRNQNDYCRSIARKIRKRGMLLQDIDLETLEFIPRDRWWETTMLSSTVRGIVGERAPKCAFISNKRGYEATFGAELLAAGHDPRDVLNKYEMERVVVPFLQRYVKKHFPWQMNWKNPAADLQFCSVNSDELEKREVESELDLVLWPAKDQAVELGGRALCPERKSPVQLQVDSNEYESWKTLIESHLDGNEGVDVQTVGQRVAPAGALRAEVTNAAARHIHSLRKRLANPQSIVTIQGQYRLANELSVGIVSSNS